MRPSHGHGGIIGHIGRDRRRCRAGLRAFLRCLRGQGESVLVEVVFVGFERSLKWKTVLTPERRQD